VEPNFEIAYKIAAILGPFVLAGLMVMGRMLANRLTLVETDMRVMMNPETGASARLAQLKLEISENMLTAEKVQREIAMALQLSPMNDRLTAIENQNSMQTKLMDRILDGLTNLAAKQHNL
jgi:hypothetical protein